MWPVPSGSIGFVLIPGRTDLRLFIGALYGIGAALGVGLLLHKLPWDTYGVTWWSITVQLVGTLLTFGGLLYAWERARRFWSRSIWPRIQRLLVKPFPQAIRVEGNSSKAAFGDMHVLRGMAPLDRTLPVEEQLRRVEEYIKTDLPQWFNAVFDNIGKVSRELQAAKTDSHTATLAAEAKARKAIRDLEKRLDSTQALDLSVAIVGLFVTAIGVFLGYWAN